MPRTPTKPAITMSAAIRPNDSVSLLPVPRFLIHPMACPALSRLLPAEFANLGLRELENFPALEPLLLALLDPGLPVFDGLGEQTGPVGGAEGNELQALLPEELDAGGILALVDLFVLGDGRLAQSEHHLPQPGRQRLERLAVDREIAELRAQGDLF